jgi:circadian clock protein KaiB
MYSGKFILKLYVSGNSQVSMMAISNIQAICDEYLKDNYDLEIIDIETNPELAEEAQIMALPTLIKSEPFPRRRLIGALTVKNRVLAGLDLFRQD